MKKHKSTRISDYQIISNRIYCDKELDKFFVKDAPESILEENELITGFERLWVLQKAYKLMQEMHKFYKTLLKDEKFQIRTQIERSSSSVCDNIAEGYPSYYYDDKIKGFNVARKEAGETQNHLRKVIGKGYIDTEKGVNWIKEYEEVIRGINGFIKYIRNKKAGK